MIVLPLPVYAAIVIPHPVSRRHDTPTPPYPVCATETPVIPYP